jgi:4a-hydroxytetrahydrobiopterin dehydratase
MAAPLAERHCAACTPGTPTLAPGEMDAYRKQLDAGWKIVERDGHALLTRTFRFKGFMPGVRLVDRFAELAEQEAHHPDLCLTYGALTVELWTHVAGGLTENDFVLAAKMDRIPPD